MHATHHVCLMCYIQDSSRLITGCNDKLIRLYDLTDGQRENALQIFQGHKDSVKSAIWTSQQNVFVSCEETTSVRYMYCTMYAPIQSVLIYFLESYMLVAPLKLCRITRHTLVSTLFYYNIILQNLCGGKLNYQQIVQFCMPRLFVHVSIKFHKINNLCKVPTCMVW